MGKSSNKNVVRITHQKKKKEFLFSNNPCEPQSAPLPLQGGNRKEVLEDDQQRKTWWIFTAAPQGDEIFPKMRIHMGINVQLGTVF